MEGNPKNQVSVPSMNTIRDIEFLISLSVCASEFSFIHVSSNFCLFNFSNVCASILVYLSSNLSGALISLMYVLLFKS